MYLLLFILGSVIIIGIAVHIDKSLREKKETERYRMQCRSRANLPETSPAPVKISRSTEFSCQEERDINMGLRTCVHRINDKARTQAHYQYLENKKNFLSEGGLYEESCALRNEVDKAWRLAKQAANVPFPTFSSPLIELLGRSSELNYHFQQVSQALIALKLTAAQEDIAATYFHTPDAVVVQGSGTVRLLVFTYAYVLCVGELTENVRLLPYTEVKVSASKWTESVERRAYANEEVAEVHYLHETKSGERDMRFTYANNPVTTTIYRGTLRIQWGSETCNLDFSSVRQAETATKALANYISLVTREPHCQTVEQGLEDPEKIRFVLKKLQEEKVARLEQEEKLQREQGVWAVSRQDLTIEDGVLTKWECSQEKAILPGGLFQEIGTFVLSTTRENLEELVVPEGVRVLRKEAFHFCKSLKRVTLPDSLEIIEDSAFYGCKSLEELVVPEGVRVLRKNAFCICESLKRVTLPDSLEIIEDSAFYGCKSLETVALGKGLRKVEDYAFSGCEFLKDVRFPEGLREIGSSSFRGCGIEKIVLPDSLEKIGSSVFSACNSLREVSLGVRIQEIPNFFFYELKELERVIVHRPIVRVGARAFENCSSFQGFQFDFGQGNSEEASMNFPEGLKSIDMRAFSGCGSLKSVRFPMSLLEIGDRAFMNCSSLQQVEGLEENQWMGKRAFFKTPWLASLAQNGFVVIRDFLEAYVGQSNTIEIPAGVKEIGPRAFENNQRIESVVIPEGVTAIGNRAFGACRKLSIVQIPDSVTQIAGDAFATCPKLKIFCYRGSAASTYRIAHKIPGEYLTRERGRSSMRSQIVSEPFQPLEKKEDVPVFKKSSSVSESLKADPDLQTGFGVLSPEERKLILNLRRKKREEQSKLGVDPTKDRPFEETGFQPDQVSLVLQNSNRVITSNLVVLRFAQSKPVGLFQPAEYEVFFADQNGRIISDVKTVKADIREGDLFHKITLSLTAQSSTVKEKSCELVLRYPGADHNAACKIPFQMNLSFVSDFDF